jgi:L-glyceraldehyde 3-phosphate reductase
MAYQPSPDRYQQFDYNRCGNSGLKLPPVSLGLWHNFGSVDNFENAWEMVQFSFDRGITHFDLANNYGPEPGSAEENFGKILKEDLAAYRDELIISTKAGYLMWDGPYGEWGSKKYLISSLEQSLKRMQLDYVDIFYSHRPDPDTPIEETVDALEQAVRSGKALYVGISNYSAEQTRAAHAELKTRGIRCLVHQPKYSMFDRWVEDGLLDTLDELGMGSVAFSPLAQGLLTDRYLDSIPKNSRAGGGSIFLNENQVKETHQTVLTLNEIAKARGQKLAQMALAWVLRRKTVTSVIIGASSTEQIAENLGALENRSFSELELGQIDEALAAHSIQI